MIPLVGGFDLSPLALLVVLQVLAIIVANLQDALLR
jgi:YggT family protein